VSVVKICGITDLAGARAAAGAGADLIGFHFCSSLRRVTPESARAILDALDRRPAVVGVFIDQPSEEARQVADFVGLDYVQLHGSEPVGYDSPRAVIKALKVRDGVVPDGEGWPDPLLLDSWSADSRGGTGRAWDWELARPLLERRRVIFAGGLSPANVGEVVRRYRPHGVDVSSGVETEPGRKDPELIRAFVEAARGHRG
jgi:phosphoribosylanthranilate isomerase